MTRRLPAALSLLVLLVMPAHAEEIALTVTSVGSGTQLPATLLKPEGDGPFPAVVMMHDCSGLGPRSSGSPRRWADQLVPQDYVVIMPDSFGPRGFPDGTCTAGPPDNRRASGYVRAADAYGTLALLRTLPYVDGRRVGIMGGSHGGWTALAALSAVADDKDPLREARRDGFTAGLALYPRCGIPFGTWSATRAEGSRGPVVSYSGIYRPLAPLLILAGELDDWTPAEECRELAVRSRAAGHPVDITIYPGAHHSFDSANPVRYVERRNNPNSPTGRGATTGGNAEAWAAAREDVRIFFARHLKAAP